MGNLRTWSIALVAGAIVAVVAHERSGAQSAPQALQPPPVAAQPAYAAPARSAGTAAPAARVTGLPDFSDLVAENGAAVVNISVVEKVQKAAEMGEPADAGDPLSQFFRHFQGQIPERSAPAHGIGSGFIISPDGYVLTNAHVVADAATVTVKLTDRREFTAKVVGVDKRSDVALIKISAGGLPTVRFARPGVEAGTGPIRPAGAPASRPPDPTAPARAFASAGELDRRERLQRRAAFRGREFVVSDFL